MNKDEELKPVDDDEDVKQVKVLVTVTVRKTLSGAEAADRVRFFLESESDWVKEVKSKLYEETEEYCDNQEVEKLIRKRIKKSLDNMSPKDKDLPKVTSFQKLLHFFGIHLKTISSLNVCYCRICGKYFMESDK
jgi:hypothetical protein